MLELCRQKKRKASKKKKTTGTPSKTKGRREIRSVLKKGQLTEETKVLNYFHDIIAPPLCNVTSIDK